MQLVPRRGREAIGRLLKVDKVLAEPDKAERAAYEERAARSEPGLEPGRGRERIGKKRTKSAARR